MRNVRLRILSYNENEWLNDYINRKVVKQAYFKAKLYVSCSQW